MTSKDNLITLGLFFVGGMIGTILFNKFVAPKMA